MRFPDGFSAELPPQLTWQHKDCVASTNTYLLDAKQPPNQLISAERQAQGRGRRGQTWVDSGDSALFSLSTAFPVGTDISAWPIQVAITLADSLNRLLAHANKTTFSNPPHAIQIKWPNDLYTLHHGQWGKCGGILVESTLSQSQQQGKIVTGVGLNLAPLHGITLHSDYPIAHLPTVITTMTTDKKQLIALLGNQLWQAWQAFSQQPSVDPMHYQTLDYLYGKSFTATDTHDNMASGRGAGINSQGHLLVQQPSGQIALSAQQRIRLHSPT